jgi:putative zinc finger/helix-turn-helix YgiT family protein
MNFNHHNADGNDCCDACGSNTVLHARSLHKFYYGEGSSQIELEIEVPMLRCQNCGLTLLGEGAEELEHAEVCRHLGRLTPDEIRNIRQQYQMSQEAFAECARVGIASIKRWESGNQIQSASQDMLLRLLHYPVNVYRANQVRLGGRQRPQFRTEITSESEMRAAKFRLSAGSELERKAA